jgi:hypothetical protein
MEFAGEAEECVGPVAKRCIVDSHALNFGQPALTVQTGI